MDIFELAAELGKALKNDKRLERLENAKNAYESDPALQKMMVEYEVQQKALQGEITYTPEILPLRNRKNNGEKDKFYVTNSHPPVVCHRTETGYW